MFHSVPGVPLVKMERFAGVDTQTCASPQRGCRRVWGEVTVCLCRAQVNLMTLAVGSPHIVVLDFNPAQIIQKS